MKLYVSAGTCSQAPHIVAREAGIELELVPVDMKTKTYGQGLDYRDINENGYVPALEVAPGLVLTEGPAIMQYLADLKPESGLAPANGTLPRYQLQQWLNFITSELHKGYSPLFNPATPEDYKTIAKDRLNSRLKWVDEQLAGKTYLMGDTFTVADGYLFTVTNWAPRVGVDISGLTHLNAYRARVGARPAVQAALKAEGLA